MATQTKRTNITIRATINAPVEKVWRLWSEPKHIVKWNNASEDWHTPRAENDLRKGGKFLSRMEARDGSTGFDFEGIYDDVDEHKLISYTMEDGRSVKITFEKDGNSTKILESFDAESTMPIEMQRDGWQAILNNFKKYVENSTNLERLYFEKTIDAPVEEVYRKMLDEKHFADWTAEFNPTSHYKGSWEKGAKILFIGSDEKGEKGGMVCRIKENIPNKYVSIESVGLLKGDQEINSGPEVEGWTGGYENYIFEDEQGKTKLTVELDTNQEYKDYFKETYPRALDRLKSICEN